VLRGARRGRVGGTAFRVGGTAFRVDGARVGEREEALGRSGGGAGRGQGRAGGQSVGGGASSVVPVMALLSNGGGGGRFWSVRVAFSPLVQHSTFSPFGYGKFLSERKVSFGAEGGVGVGEVLRSRPASEGSRGLPAEVGAPGPSRSQRRGVGVADPRPCWVSAIMGLVGTGKMAPCGDPSAFHQPRADERVRALAERADPVLSGQGPIGLGHPIVEALVGSAPVPRNSGAETVGIERGKGSDSFGALPPRPPARHKCSLAEEARAGW
jgi:hypothetical protein